MVEAVVESGNNKPNNQAPPEAYNLMGKSMEELAKKINSLEEKLEKDKSEKSKLQENLADVQSKLDNKNLPRDPHETDEYLEEQKLFLVNELRKVNNRIDETHKELTQTKKTQTDTITTGASVAGGSISGAN